MFLKLPRFGDAKVLGPINYVNNAIERRRAAMLPRSAPYKLRSRLANTPIICRTHTTDEAVFNSIFIEQEYSCLNEIKNVKHIIDCGANIGCSSVYFLSRFADARVISIEPDAENFSQLTQNLKPYGPRATCLHAAIWPKAADLRIAREPYRGGAHWARQVEESGETVNGGLAGMSIPMILTMNNIDRISILKIDIEGAEVPLFAQSGDWLDRVDNLVVELHDDSHFGNATETFHRAIAGRGFMTSSCGELTVALRSASR